MAVAGALAVPLDMMAPPSAVLPVLPEVPSAPMAWLWTKLVWRTVRVPVLKMPPPKASTTAGARAREADDLVVGQDGMGEGQGAGVQDAAALPNGPPVGDGQVVDAHRHAAADPEDPAGVVAADGQPAGARAVDPQVVRDAQLPARQGDRAVAGRAGEADRRRRRGWRWRP